MRRWLVLLAIAARLDAHAISMSHGLLRIQSTPTGAIASYELRMPSYEMVHLSKPEETLFSAIHFVSNGVEAKTMERSCHDDTSISAFVCDALYQFPAPVHEVRVECTFARDTVPNHIHLLRAINAGRSDQLMFDQRFEDGYLRFRPATAIETAVKNITAGMSRVLQSIPGLLFLALLAMAGRSAREFAALLAAYLVGQTISCVALPHMSFDPSPAFIVAAIVITSSYLLFEIVFLSRGSGRWIVCAVLGLMHGMYYFLLLRDSGMSAGYVLTGAFFTEATAALIAFCATSWMAKTLRGRRLISS